MKTKHYSALALLLSMYVNNSYAGNEAPSWSLLGPAFSKHFAQAPIIGSFEAIRNDGGNELGDQTFDDGLRHVTVNDACKAALVGQAQIDCIKRFSRPYLAKIPIRKWNQNNLELGFQKVSRSGGLTEKISFGAVIDSYKKPSAFLAKTSQKTFYESDLATIDLGVSYFLWFRTVHSDLNGAAKRRFVVGALPTMSFDVKPLGGGLDLMYAPALRINGVVYSVDTVMLQFKWRIK